MRLSKEAQAKIKKIQSLEAMYHPMVFRMGLVHLMGTGHENFDEASVEAGFKLISDEEEAAKASGERTFISPDFKREILRCSAELAKFEILVLFAYIKKHFVLDI